MAAVTICSDFGAQESQVCHYFHCFPIYLPGSFGTNSHDLRFLNVEFPPKRDTVHPRAKEKLLQDCRRDKITFRIKPHTCQRCSEGSNETLCTPGHRDPTGTETDLCLSLLQRYGSAAACHRGRGSGCSLIIELTQG